MGVITEKERTKCAFYMPPHIEPDNCGNYVVMQPTVEMLDKIRDEIEAEPYISKMEVLDIIDKYKSESEET